MSCHSIFMYTDHSALTMLLCEIDNDAYERIARCQNCLVEYNFYLFHRTAVMHFMGIIE